MQEIFADNMRPSKYLTFGPSKFAGIFEEKGVKRKLRTSRSANVFQSCKLVVE